MKGRPVLTILIVVPFMAALAIGIAFVAIAVEGKHPDLLLTWITITAVLYILVALVVFLKRGLE